MVYDPYLYSLVLLKVIKKNKKNINQKPSKEK